MKDILEAWLAEDLGNGDATSNAVVENTVCEAKVTGGPGILSGLKICMELLDLVDVNYKTTLNDGDPIKSGTTIFHLSGRSHDILKAERLLLNILCHLSGVATFTSDIVTIAKSVNPRVEILATRKTIPGMRVFEKEAVSHGGGQTHRFTERSLLVNLAPMRPPLPSSLIAVSGYTLCGVMHRSLHR